MKKKPFALLALAFWIAVLGYALVLMLVVMVLFAFVIVAYQSWPPDLSNIAKFFIGLVVILTAIGIWTWAIKYLGWDE